LQRRVAWRAQVEKLAWDAVADPRSFEIWFYFGPGKCRAKATLKPMP